MKAPARCNDILAGYAAAATPELIARYEAVDCRTLYAAVLDLLPEMPVRVADIGAGTGRDAAWFARQGHQVLAVEPVRELREAGMALHRASDVAWLDDALPALERTQRRGPFGLVTLCGVWQHIDDAARGVATTALGRMVADGGLLVLSLRHGPGAPGRPVFPISPRYTVEAAVRSGFAPLREVEVGSLQPGNRAAEVRWTWLALRKAA
ncbi:SAM-dependent methyltransferase [Constrictibacter sp. MBR-5]|uniref:class I SAM-dependent methyltransferase n=1 Tax=Constrictibacter sp. MBR-5 TaxID=3156467 RepID=UPI003393C361